MAQPPAQPLEFTTTQQGKQKLALNGYQYVFQKDLANGVAVWECVQRRNKHLCKSNVKISNHGIIGHPNDHTHPPAPEVEADRARGAIQLCAQQTQEQTRLIVANNVQ